MKPETTGGTGAQAPPTDVVTDQDTDDTLVPGRWLALAVVLSAVFMQLLDTTITMVALPSLQNDLGATFAEIQLVIAVYLLSFACMLVTGGRLGDIYGRKKMFMIGMVGFTTASLLCGAAMSPTMLILSRVIQGLFSGLMFPQVLSTIQVIFSDRERPKALGFYGASIGMGTVLGPVLGGWLIDLDILGTDWRSIFYVNLPIGLCALAIGMVKIPESSSESAHRLDLTGAALLTTGLFFLILPLVIGREHDWPTWSLLMLVSSPLFLIVFGFYEKRLTARPGSSPLVPTGLFKERSFTLGLTISVVFFGGVPSFVMLFFLTLQVGFGYSAISAGGVTVTFALMVAVGSARSFTVVSRLGTLTLALGSGLMLVGSLGMMYTVSAAGTDLRGWYMIPSLMVYGLGGGLFLAPCAGIILAGIRSREAGTASGMVATTQQVGAATGIAIAGIIFFNLLGSGAMASADSVVPQLKKDLAATGLPAPAQEEAVAGFRTCFDDRMNQKDLSEVPESCERIEEQMRNSPAPPEVKEKVQAAVLGQALPEARKQNISDSFIGSLYWQIGVFLVTCLLVLALPRVKPTNLLPGGA